ncbi:MULTISPECIES: hypothetical protein [unclassified Mesorhizobium]|uniref:hypothetical protein n=1 Tax=unclassified Mesorhizobium TaxID=325217 RepID=UPI0015C6D491|nr:MULTISPECIES: hypothetical protein [unclassified Mesorhizobium]
MLDGARINQVDPSHCHLFAADAERWRRSARPVPRDIVTHMKMAGGIAASGHSYC